MLITNIYILYSRASYSSVHGSKPHWPPLPWDLRNCWDNLLCLKGNHWNTMHTIIPSITIVWNANDGVPPVRHWPFDHLGIFNHSSMCIYKKTHIKGGYSLLLGQPHCIQDKFNYIIYLFICNYIYTYAYTYIISLLSYLLCIYICVNINKYN